jgi:hypothetical protein
MSPENTKELKNVEENLSGIERDFSFALYSSFNLKKSSLDIFFLRLLTQNAFNVGTILRLPA